MDGLIDSFEYITIIILTSIIIWMFFQRANSDKSNKPLQWINQGHPSGKYGKFNPAQRLNDLISKYGLPDIIDKEKGGSAIWKRETLNKKGFCWDRVEIRDEQIPHNNPAPHVDFLYSWYKLHVPKKLICDVIKLSESVTYDPLKQMLRVRCHAEGPNYATMVLAKRIATEEMSLDEAKKSYGPFIFATIKNHEMYNPDALKSYEEELCEFKKQQKWKI